jgi:hypothetical protein
VFDGLRIKGKIFETQKQANKKAPDRRGF